MKILDVFLTLIFGTSSTILILLNCLSWAGLWKLFEKCGATPWHAVIPYYREYVLAECAGREPEGRVVYIASIISSLCGVGLLFFNHQGVTGITFDIIQIVAGLVVIIYEIRIFAGLTEVFGRSKFWIPFWMLLDWITAPIWGFSSRFQPKWKLEDFEGAEAEFFSGAHVAALDKGLAVNINERTVREFFKKKYLLRDIHMYIKPGSMVLLLGGSGAGKTTFLNAVNGYEKARAEIVLNGENVYRSYKSMKYNVGFVPQQDLMRGNDTVLRTLTDAAAIRLPVVFDAKERRARVDEVMKIFGLTHAQGHLVDKLSGGQRKRLSIAMELISNPALFILDEPDSGLDGVMARELMQQLRKVADQGKIVIVITHTPDRVIDLFDDVIVLAKDAGRVGRLAFYGPVDEARAFFGKERMEQIVKSINRPEEGGEGKADEYIMKYAEVQHG